MFGSDPSDFTGTIAAELVHSFYPRFDPIVALAGIVVVVLTLIGFVRTVRLKWDDGHVDGFAAFCGFTAGGLTLVWKSFSIVFWLLGIIAGGPLDQ
jgi:hypothetical protein